MLNEITLFHLVREDIKIDIVARFENEVLVIDGYDTGKTVEAYYGRSDYEYTTTIPENGVDILYTHFGILNKDKEALLHALAAKYNSNTCYSEIQDLLGELNIHAEGFRWP